MIKLENSVKNERRNNMGEKYFFIDSTIQIAIEALEKQMPKKPIHKHKNYYCPICKEDGWVLWDDAEPNDFDNFCGKCGQALDWSMGNICDSGKENNMKNLKIKKVVFNPPATIVFWSDNTKTVVKSTNELYDGEKGMAMAIAKKFLGTNDTKSNYYDEFHKWLKDAPDCTNCKHDTCESNSNPCWSCTDNYSNFERKE